MEAVWPIAVARMAKEVADMQAIADAEGADFAFAASRFPPGSKRAARFSGAEV